MQHLLKNGPDEEKQVLYEVLIKNFPQLSLTKCGSHVTEKAMSYSNDIFKQKVLNHLLQTDPYT